MYKAVGLLASAYAVKWGNLDDMSRREKEKELRWFDDQLDDIADDPDTALMGLGCSCEEREKAWADAEELAQVGMV